MDPYKIAMWKAAQEYCDARLRGDTYETEWRNWLIAVDEYENTRI